MNVDGLDPNRVRKDFPIFNDGKLVYLDSASSSDDNAAQRRLADHQTAACRKRS